MNSISPRPRCPPRSRMLTAMKRGFPALLLCILALVPGCGPVLEKTRLRLDYPPGEVEVVTEGKTYTAARVIVTAGAWAPARVGAVPRHKLTIAAAMNTLE